MSDFNQTSNFLDEIIKAREDSRRLPQIEVERDRAKGEAEMLRQRLEEAWRTIDTLNGDISQLNAKVAEVQKKADDATFRESEARDKLEVLVGAFKSVNREISETVELVSPAPAPQPEAAPVVENPTPQGGSNGTMESVSGIPTTDLPGTYQAATGFVPNDYNEPTEVDRKADGPFASSTADQSPPAESASTEEQAAPSSNDVSKTETDSPPKPYVDRPYWYKPDSLSWDVWIAGGGDAPPWNWQAI